MISEMFSGIIQWYMTNINYGTITALMAIESSFIPFPSEIIVPPAAWKAAQGELSIAGVFAAATAGALIGALINYYLALILGRKIVYRLAATRWARLLLIDEKGVQRAEAYFRRYGKSSTFIGRLVPAVRQLISLPAGLARMDMRSFLLFTTLGAGLWNVILVALGYFLYSQKSLLDKYYSYLSYGAIGLAVLFVGYIVYRVVGVRAKDRDENGSGIDLAGE